MIKSNLRKLNIKIKKNATNIFRLLEKLLIINKKQIFMKDPEQQGKNNLIQKEFESPENAKQIKIVLT